MKKTSQRVERETLAGLQRRSRRGFLAAAVVAVAGGGMWKWLNDRPEVDGLASPFRKAMELNAGIARRIFRERALAPATYRRLQPCVPRTVQQGRNLLDLRNERLRHRSS